MENKQWDTVGILCRVWMDVYHSSALQDPFTEEAVEPTLRRRWILGNRSKLMLPSSYGLPTSYAARLKRSGLCSSHQCCRITFLWKSSLLEHHLGFRGLPLPDPAVCVESRAQVLSSDAKHCKCVSWIFLKGKKTQRMAEVRKEEFCI